MLKGLILAGGIATRLRPLTNVINKQLLPVYNKPLVYYPIETLKAAGVTEILLVSGKDHAGQFLSLLGSGKELGVRISYEVQDTPGGLAQVLGMSEVFADGGDIMMILGDNIYEDIDVITQGAEEFRQNEGGAMVFLKHVHDPERFGVAEIEDGKIVRVEEKPAKPKTDLAITGLYMFDNRCYDVVRNLKPSARGELEITDVNQWYVDQGEMSYKILEGEWIDAGTFDSLLRANNFAARKWAETHPAA